MITIGEWLNPTKTVGLLAYGAATLCCGIAWAKAKKQPEVRRLAALLMCVESVLLLDIAFNWRWMLHQFAMDLAQRRHEYEFRRAPQMIALGVLVALLLLGLLAVRRFFRSTGGSRLAVSGVLLSVILWGTEVISLHQVDHYLYHRLGPIMVVSLLWVLACVMTSIGMLYASYSRSVRNSKLVTC
jgi:hypothetical protein